MGKSGSLKRIRKIIQEREGIRLVCPECACPLKDAEPVYQAGPGWEPEEGWSIGNYAAIPMSQCPECQLVYMTSMEDDDDYED